LFPFSTTSNNNQHLGLAATKLAELAYECTGGEVGRLLVKSTDRNLFDATSQSGGFDHGEFS
jgi:hypothetical protein